MKKLIKHLITLYRERFIRNLYNSKYKKRVLISYITSPFRKNNLNHTNAIECRTAAKIFHELGYQVDIMYYLFKNPDLKEYDVIYGLGDVFQHYYESGLTKKKTIHYATGTHVCHQNKSTLKRIKDVHDRRGVWLTKSARVVEKTWSHQTTLVDGIIALGNESCSKTYREHYEGKILEVAAPFFNTIDGRSVIKTRNIEESRHHFLWFGSTGLIHKGLDLCLEYFSSKPHLTLHVCANIDLEPDFSKEYYNELQKTPNIKYHGFINIKSDKFKEIITQCLFLIHPSCSEGGGASIITAIGNGGLIPIISKESSVSTGYEITIESLTIQGLGDSIEYALNLEDKKLEELQMENFYYVNNNHSQTKYHTELKKSIIEILN